MGMFAEGLFCRLLQATTLLRGASENYIKVEFTTPRNARAPNGVLVCMTAAGHTFDTQNRTYLPVT